jgi:hypothetical protein
MNKLPTEVILERIFPLLWEVDILCLALCSKWCSKLLKYIRFSDRSIYVSHIRRILKLLSVSEDANLINKMIVLNKWKSPDIDNKVLSYFTPREDQKYSLINIRLYLPIISDILNMYPARVYYIINDNLFEIEIDKHHDLPVDILIDMDMDSRLLLIPDTYYHYCAVVLQSL